MLLVAWEARRESPTRAREGGGHGIFQNIQKEIKYSTWEFHEYKIVYQ